jgi:excisionase family DNA binding protein
VAAPVEAPNPYLRRAEAAKLLCVSARTLTNLQKRGAIPYHKLSRLVLFRRTDIEQALDRFRHAAVGE